MFKIEVEIRGMPEEGKSYGEQLAKLEVPCEPEVAWAVFTQALSMLTSARGEIIEVKQ